MPRLPRYILPGQPQHLIQRGNNRCPLFLSDVDYRVFLDYFSEACEKNDCLVHAYVLMTNHVHFLVTPETNGSVAKTMQSVGRRYVQYFNVRTGRTGTLWEGRYRATVIGGDRYFYACSRYIELNPVRAGMVEYPEDYAWSSYRGNALGQFDAVIAPAPANQNLGDGPHARCRQYRSMFDDELTDESIEEIRRLTQKGWALGSENFKDEIEALTSRRTRPRPRGGDHRSEKFRGYRTRLKMR